MNTVNTLIGSFGRCLVMCTRIFLFHQRLIEKRITYTYLSPLYLNKYGLMDTPDMRYIAVSFEPIIRVHLKNPRQ